MLFTGCVSHCRNRETARMRPVCMSRRRASAGVIGVVGATALVAIPLAVAWSSDEGPRHDSHAGAPTSASTSRQVETANATPRVVARSLRDLCRAPAVLVVRDYEPDRMRRASAIAAARPWARAGESLRVAGTDEPRGRTPCSSRLASSRGKSSSSSKARRTSGGSRELSPVSFAQHPVTRAAARPSRSTGSGTASTARSRTEPGPVSAAPLDKASCPAAPASL
jgi:hypothetical protein